MKIIEYTLGLPPYRRGGLPRYSLDISTELAKSNDVYLMYPGQMNLLNSGKIRLKKNKSKYGFKVIELENPLPVTLGLGVSDEKSLMVKKDISEFKKFILSVCPDIFHIHTLMGLPKECFEFLKYQKVKLVYTTHDFYGLCPKMLSTNALEKLQSTKCSDDCMLCSDGLSLSKIKVMQSHAYKNIKNSGLMRKLRRNGKTNLRNESLDEHFLTKKRAIIRYELRNYYLSILKLIDKFHFVSSVAEGYFRNFLPNVDGEVIAITHSGLVDHRNYIDVNNEGIFKFAYVGPYDVKKGFFDLKEVIKELNSEGLRFEAHFFGDVANDPIFNLKNVFNHGIVPYEKLQNYYREVSIVVLPSRWHETFGFITLEALLQGTPVFVSSNVGSKDLIPDKWVFSSKFQLKNKLKSEINDHELVNEQYLVVKNLKINFSVVEHVKKVVSNLYL